jgi:hypothetical protein
MAQTRKRRGRSKAGVGSAKPEEIQFPARGVRLKVVSLLTMAFAILCLAAFLAGHTNPPERVTGPIAGDVGLVAPQAAANAIAAPARVRE